LEILLDTAATFLAKRALPKKTTTKQKRQNIMRKKERTKIMKPLIKLKTTTLLVIPLVLAGFALFPRAQAETPAEPISPAVFAEKPGFNTAGGINVLSAPGLVGTLNSGFGALALEDNTTGHDNTALGAQALRNNTIGFQNTAVGENALVKNVDGNGNMALGQGSLANNLTGDNNVAMGFQALNANTASSNVAVGFQALRSNETGTNNVATGFQALFSNNEAANCTAVGGQALLNSTGHDNIALGALAGGAIAGGHDNIDIGNVGNVGDSGTIRIGGGSHTATFIAGISGVNQGGAGILPVQINNAGRLGTTPSARRFKKEIKPMEQSSEAILSLKPVMFQYKDDNTGTAQFGLIAEEVAKINPDLIVRDEKGDIYSVRYDAVNAMLLNEFLKEHKKVEELEATVASLAAAVKEQAAQIQKVSAQLEVSKPAPQVVGNNR
jgi:trimeric autotransporter adhesin